MQKDKRTAMCEDCTHRCFLHYCVSERRVKGWESAGHYSLHIYGVVWYNRGRNRGEEDGMGQAPENKNKRSG